MSEVTTQEIGQIENVLINGDLAKLSERDKVFYYNKVCESVGLNPLTRPFGYIKLNNKLTLYAKRDCADQLRQLHGVSIKVIQRGEVDGQYEVHVAAQDRKGRTDEDIGAVPISGLRGEARSNAIAKAMTKAKRRVTLSICGLGLLDETEASDIKGVKDISYNLDEIFPDEEKPEALTAPPVSESGVLDTKGPEKEDVSPASNKEPTIKLSMKFPNYMNLSDLTIEDHGEYFKEYKKQLKVLSEDTNLPARDRMSTMHEFEELNQEALNLLPHEAFTNKKKTGLYDIRIKYNKSLGVQK
jgi:hypothetical protein